MNTTEANLKRILAPDATYRQAVAREVATWNSRLEPERRLRVPRYRPVLLAHANRSTTGEAGTDWPMLVKRRFGRFERGLSLGGGTGVMEERLLRMGLFRSFEMCDLSPEMPEAFIARMRNAAADCEHLAASSQDLNFMQLEEGRYDCILCNTILHHIVNLEHLLTEVNKALAPGGVFIVVDYVGESRFQWHPGKVGLINGLLEGLHKEGVRCRPLHIRPASRVVAHSPFEAVRSSETHGLLRDLFMDSTLEEHVYFTLIHPIYRCLDFNDWDDPGLCRALEVFVAVDQALAGTEIFPPCMLFGIYGKSSRMFGEVRPWSEARKARELSVEGIRKLTDLAGRASARLFGLGRRDF